jgi:acylphosphatase
MRTTDETQSPGKDLALRFPLTTTPTPSYSNESTVTRTLIARRPVGVSDNVIQAIFFRGVMNVTAPQCNVDGAVGVITDGTVQLVFCTDTPRMNRMVRKALPEWSCQRLAPVLRRSARPTLL